MPDIHRKPAPKLLIIRCNRPASQHSETEQYSITREFQNSGCTQCKSIRQDYKSSFQFVNTDQMVVVCVSGRWSDRVGDGECWWCARPEEEEGRQDPGPICCSCELWGSTPGNARPASSAPAPALAVSISPVSPVVTSRAGITRGAASPCVARDHPSLVNNDI